MALEDWKSRLILAIASGTSDLTVDEARRDDRCAFGKWLRDDIGALERQSPRYPEAVEVHAQFHEEAAKVLALALERKQTEALALTEQGSPFSTAWARLATILIHWLGARWPADALSTSETALLLGVPVREVVRLIDLGELDGVRLPGRDHGLHVTTTSLDRYRRRLARERPGLTT